jgi:hypothetical protein
MKNTNEEKYGERSKAVDFMFVRYIEDIFEIVCFDITTTADSNQVKNKMDKAKKLFGYNQKSK